MKRFSIVNNGYDIDEVNKFVDIVIRKLELLNNDNIKCKRQIENLEEQLKQSIKIEDKLSHAILAAEETAEKMKKLAKVESEMLVDDAKRNANAIIHEALVQSEKVHNEAEILRKNITVYKNRVKSLLQSQLEIADELDSIKL